MEQEMKNAVEAVDTDPECQSCLRHDSAFYLRNRTRSKIF